MIEQIKQHWRAFRESKPGQRFKDHYRRRRQDEQSHMAWRIFLITIGAVIALGSLVLAPLPGPGWATVFIGLMILAGEVLPAARFLDWLEVWLRKLGRLIHKIWQASVLGKIAVILAAALCVATTIYVVYLLLFSGSLFQLRRFEHIKRAIAKTKAGWRHWRTFREIDAGHRYQSRYHFHQRRTRKGLVSAYWRPFSLFCGPILIIMGFVFIPTPGPSYIIIAIGLWLLAGEFLLLARLFDRVGARL